MKSLLTRNISPRAALAVVVLVLLASVVSGREKRDLKPEPEPAARITAPARATESPADLDLEKLNRPRRQEAITDLFAPPPAASAASAAPAPVQAATRPTAPPLPFRYLAKIIDGDHTAVFLMNGEDHYNVKPGQVIDKTYKVERVTETAVTFTYLPLGTRQVLPVPALN
jgi:hypothetical protein